ncbi:chemotaxis protein CheA [Ideonella sp. A 288]|uniref:chemotaxis protein CheA n=1 Tax=Ideonella sp. A 288 TaxID=1962181 RepID=UPI000B4BA0ED|nr:chemotaxis protein CheA [Ideonella sp. A 288]
MKRDDDDEILAAARVGFLDEAQDMLRQFEQALLVMETAPDDHENLNAAFRAAHTIKGTAGLFGFEAVVAFTHDAETLLEGLRSAQIVVSEPVIALLLRSRDEIERLLDEVRTGTADLAAAAAGAALGAELRAAMAGGSGSGASAAAAAHDTVADSDGADGEQAGAWHLSLRFGGDALRNGLDPLSFIRYLDSVGTVLGIETLADAVPALEALDPEHCHLGFEIRLDSPGPRSLIEQVFDFCAEDCDIAILSPDFGPNDFDALLLRRCGDDADATTDLLDLWDRLGFRRPEARAPAAKAAAPVEAKAAAMATTGTASAPTAAAPAPGGTDRRQATRDRRNADANAGSFIRVRADKLDRLIDIIGELVIASSGAQLVADEAASAPFHEAALRIAGLVEDARDRALGLRMVPIGETFARFQRVVRDVSKQLGKEVDLELTGGDTELDKAMVEVIADPLMHLVRNSLDHGIEIGADRVAAGKSAKGRLALNAYQESGQIVIEVSDDGKGLKRDRILAKAIERGLVSPDAVLSDAEVNELILMPGFSTAEQVTDLSGRGVGMDVVRRNIESLRGQMHIASTEGAGTTIQIRLPLTLAIIDGFLTNVAGIHYVVPLESVVECIENPPACHADASGGNGCFDLRGEVLPFVDLRRCFRLDGERPPRQSMLIVRTERSKVGLLVDRLHGQHQTVIKPLARVFAQLRGIAGSTILGSGEVALVLDVSALVAHVVQRPNSPLSSAPRSAAAH